MRRLLLVGLLFAASCGSWSPVSPDADPREQHVLDETARFSRELGIDVTGSLTDDIYWVTAADGSGDTVPAAGWYSHGTAWYWRPNLLKHDLAYGTALAAEETCHALHAHHDKALTDCISRVMA